MNMVKVVELSLKPFPEYLLSSPECTKRQLNFDLILMPETKNNYAECLK